MVFFSYQLVQALVVETSEHIAALGFKLTERANEARAGYQIRRWRVARIAEALVSGGHRKHLAKHLGLGVYAYIQECRKEAPNWLSFYGECIAIDPPSAEFDPNLPSLFVKYDTDIGEYITSLKDECKLTLPAKFKTLDEHLKKHEFVGTVGHVVGARTKEDFVGKAKLLHTDQPQSEAWAMVSQQNIKRNDCATIPLNGMASIFQAVDQQMIVYTCPMEKFLIKGVALSDFEMWLESLSGQAFLKTEMLAVVVNVGCSLFIPSGSFWAVAHIEVDKYNTVDEQSDDDSDAEKPQVQLTENSTSHSVVWPMFVQSWIDEMPPNVQSAVVSWNKVTFDMKIGKPASKAMWKDRANLLYKVMHA